MVKEHLNNIGKFIMSRPNTESTETVERLLIKNESRKKELENELLLYEVSDVESINIAELITMRDMEAYFLKIIDGLINPATTRETLYSVVDNIVVNCKEEVSIDVEIRENIKETVSYVLDLIGKGMLVYNLYPERDTDCIRVVFLNAESFWRMTRTV